jgi:hypothetical protein
LPEAHAELAAVAAFLDYDLATALRHFQLATAREPIPAVVRHLYGFFYLLPLGLIRSHCRVGARAEAGSAQCGMRHAVCYWSAERKEEAVRQFRQAVELD